MDSEDVILAFHKPPGTSARGVRQNSTPDKESSTAKPSCSYLNAYTGTIHQSQKSYESSPEWAQMQAGSQYLWIYGCTVEKTVGYISVRKEWGIDYLHKILTTTVFRTDMALYKLAIHNCWWNEVHIIRSIPFEEVCSNYWYLKHVALVTTDTFVSGVWPRSQFRFGCGPRNKNSTESK